MTVESERPSSQGEQPRAHVLEAFELSMQEFDELYKNLAK
jgi:hypothetical protein